MHITFASYDMSGVKFINKTETYDGTVKTIGLTGELPEGVTVKYFSNGSIFNGKTNVGTYTVVAVFTSTNPNYSHKDSDQTLRTETPPGYLHVLPWVLTSVLFQTLLSLLYYFQY